MQNQKDANISNYVVENKKGERMSIRSYQYMFERLTEKAGVRKLNFHALRHTFATRAIECGMDIKTLSEIMGHKNASITLNRYAHSMMDTKIEMMNRLPKNFQYKTALNMYFDAEKTQKGRVFSRKHENTRPKSLNIYFLLIICFKASYP